MWQCVPCAVPPGCGGGPRGCRCWRTVCVPPRLSIALFHRRPRAPSPPQGWASATWVCVSPASSSPPSPPWGKVGWSPSRRARVREVSPSLSWGLCPVLLSAAPASWHRTGTAPAPRHACLLHWSAHAPLSQVPSLPGHANSPGPHATTWSLPAGGEASRRHSCSCQQFVPDAGLPVPRSRRRTQAHHSGVPGERPPHMPGPGSCPDPSLPKLRHYVGDVRAVAWPCPGAPRPAHPQGPVITCGSRPPAGRQYRGCRRGRALPLPLWLWRWARVRVRAAGRGLGSPARKRGKYGAVRAGAVPACRPGRGSGRLVAHSHAP